MFWFALQDRFVRIQRIQNLSRPREDLGQGWRKGMLSKSSHHLRVSERFYWLIAIAKITEHNLNIRFDFHLQSFTFLNKKCERSYLLKRNPRKVTWTVLYRRKHKKGIEEEATKKRTRRTQKFQRAIVGASLTEILAKRNMKPEVRKAQREQAIK